MRVLNKIGDSPKISVLDFNETYVESTDENILHIVVASKIHMEGIKRVSQYREWNFISHCKETFY